MAMVLSALPESTTMISSAQAALSMASAICAASSSVMIVTVTRGTGQMLSHGRGLRASGPARGSAGPARGSAGRALQRCLLHGFQIDDRAMEIQYVLQLHVPRLREIALRLEHEEAGRGPRLELSLLSLETPLGE